MSPQQQAFHNLRNYPLRLNREQAAWYLGVAVDHIAILMGHGLLKPLGDPPKTGAKYFATCELTRLRDDLRWLTKMTNLIYAFWSEKNALREDVKLENARIARQFGRN